MALFDPKKIEKVVDSVKESDLQEKIKLQNEERQTIKVDNPNKVGRPTKKPEERKKSSPVSMTDTTLNRIELYKKENSPGMSRSGVIVELLEEILEMKGY